MATEVFRLVIQSLIAGEQAENSLYYSVQDPTGPVQPTNGAFAVLINFENNVLPNWLAVLSRDYLCVSASCKKITNFGGPAVKRVYGTNHPGASAFYCFSPLEGAVLLSYADHEGATKVNWPSAKIFMPGCPSNAILSGNFSAGYQTALRLLSQTINTPTTVAGFNLW
jgi:hypothetical protein